MLRWIEKTRNKPKAVRNHYAFLGAIGATGLIALIWALSLPTHFAEVDLAGDDATKETAGAFSQFFNDAKQNIAGVINSAAETEDEAAAEIIEEPQNSTNPIVIPELSEKTVNTAQVKQDVLDEPKPRTVLISTSSDESTIE